MTRGSSFTMAILLAFLLAVPLLPIGSSEGTEPFVDGPPSRYGFTPALKNIATPSSEAICVASGDFDGTNNDDVAIGINGAVIVYTNNGGTGSSFGFTPYRTISLSGYFITRIKAIDYDNDDDVDIIALGQDEYGMANEAGDGITQTLGTMRVYYLENTGTGFILETYYELDDTFYMQDGIQFTSAWFWTGGKYDMDSADVDGDDDVDTVVFYSRDTDSDADTGGEEIAITLLRYDAGSLLKSDIETISAPASWNMACFVRFGDFNMDGNPDLAYTYGGVSNNAWLMVQAFVKFHSGSGYSYGTPLDIDPTHQMWGDGSFPSVPYSLAVGNFAGQLPVDVAISINDAQNVNPPYTDGQIYIIKKKPTTTSELDFYAPEGAYSEDYNFQFRGMAVGNLDNIGADDVVTFTKQDDGSDDDYFNAPTDYGLTILAGRSAIPVRFNIMKQFENGGGIPSNDLIKDVATGNFDGDATYDDIIYVGNNVVVGLTTFPPNNVPSKVSVSMNPSPVLNNNQTCTINITVEDLDHQNDLSRIEIDFLPIGLPFKSLEGPTGYSESEDTIAYYEFTMKVPSWIPQGDYEVNITMYDRAPVAKDPKSYDKFTFRVKQFNREPIIRLEQGNRSIKVNEDTVTYIEGVYNWFRDDDILGGYDTEPLNISLKTQGGQWLTTIEFFEVFKAELVNGSAVNPEEWALKITPFRNFNHELNPFAPDVITLRAVDSKGAESDELVMNVDILPVNDLPTIPPQGRPNPNFNYILEQDDDGYTRITARDLADDPEDMRLHLGYSLLYDDPSDEEWLWMEEDRIFWRPTNDHVGPHRTILRVNDTFDHVDQALWFNVTNVIDKPFFVSVSNDTKTVDLSGGIQGRYLFTVYEHEEFNLTVVADDLDIHIGKQSEIIFRCNLTLSDNTYLDVDPENPTVANLHFWAEKRYGYPPTYEPDYPPIDTEIMIEDENDPDVFSVLPIRIRIINVNDPPLFVSIDEPEEGEDFPILYRIHYSAGEVLDPDTDLNDTLTFVWDFDISDGLQEDSTLVNGDWNFPRAGEFTITLRVYDNAGNFKEAIVNITVNGYADEEDFDNDGMKNDWEIEHGFDPYNPEDANTDSDGDEWTNLDEYRNGTDPRIRDTDKDGIVDGLDWSPLDPAISTQPSDDEGWVSENFGLFLILIILGVIILLLLISGTLFVLIRKNRSKAEEEERRRKMAEEMQKNLYEGQDLYTDLPQMEAPEGIEAGPSVPQLPPQEPGEIDDIFGDTGILPSQPETTALPPQQPGSGAPALPPQKAPGGAATDDLSDLLD